MSEVKIKCAYNKLVPLNELRTHPKNRNSHSPEQVARLAQIMEYQGIRHPIIISNLSGFITAGHGRLEAAKKLGLKEYPCDFQDYPNEEAEYAFLQSDNAIASWAELDLAGINSDLGDLGPDFDIEMLGLNNFLVEPAEKFLEKELWDDEFQQPDETFRIAITVSTKGEQETVLKLLNIKKPKNFNDGKLISVRYPEHRND